LSIFCRMYVYTNCKLAVMGIRTVYDVYMSFNVYVNFIYGVYMSCNVYINFIYDVYMSCNGI